MYIKIITADRLLDSMRFVDDLEANLLDDNVNPYLHIDTDAPPSYCQHTT